MSSLLYRLNHVLSRVVADVPLGTNLGLFSLLWTLLSGRLLTSRGAVIPALAAFGLCPAAVRRAWAALAYGRWSTAALLAAWFRVVQDDGHWQAHRHGGYCPVACDLVGFWRPRLQAHAKESDWRAPGVSDSIEPNNSRGAILACRAPLGHAVPAYELAT